MKMSIARSAKPPLLSSQEFHQTIHQQFARMRRETPVQEVRLTRWTRAFLITRYDDVVAALKDPRLVKNPNNARSESGSAAGFWIPKPFRPLMHNMLNSDEPDHRRLRNLVHKAFTPRMIAGMEERIRVTADQLLDDALTQQRVDLIRSFALPLPVTVIAEMIGIPPKDRKRFRAWTKQIVVNPTPLNMMRALPAVWAFMRYMRTLAAERRMNPQDDLLTALVQAENEGERFSEDELLGMTFLLLVAGHETTVNLIANGARALLTNPEQWQHLRKDPSLIDSAVEELLRYDGPLQTTEMSFAAEEIQLHDVTIPQGATVLPAILSANRDKEAFTEPDMLDLTRSPNKHLAFGHGIHYCLGAPLARLEGKIAFQTLLERTPNLRLAVDAETLRYRNVMIVHRLENLPVILG